MTQITIRHASHQLLNTVTSQIQRYWAINKPLTLLSILTLMMSVATATAVVLSPATVLNEPAWLKPTKFSVSLFTYGFTLLLFAHYVRGKWAQRLVKGTSWVILLTFLPLVGLIIFQASRGVRSHFNFATPFDGALFGTMGMLAISTWVATLIFGVVLLFQRLPNRAFSLSIKLGLVMALIGSALGYLMIPPTAEQTAVLESGRQAETIGAHTVGYADGGPGLPIVGWSTEGGDLRIPHFFGLHGLQLLPLLGLFLQRSGTSARKQVGYVWTGAVGYLGLIGVLTWQALRGQSIIAPDALTLGAMGILLVLVTAVGLFIHRMK